LQIFFLKKKEVFFCFPFGFQKGKPKDKKKTRLRPLAFVLDLRQGQRGERSVVALMILREVFDLRSVVAPWD
jgi:hypothetical protein